MNYRIIRRLKALLAAALGFFLLVKVLDGTILFYINQRFIWLVLTAGIFLIVAAQVVFSSKTPEDDQSDADHSSHEHDHNHSVRHVHISDLMWMMVPLVIGFMIPARPLSASAITSRGLSLTAPVSSVSDQSMILQISPENRTILELVQLFNRSDNPQEFDGLPVEITGFVSRDYRLADDQLFIGRFILTCCAADATAVGLVVQTKDAANFPDSTWVTVRGFMSSIDIDGELLPYVISDSIETIPQPLQPYLYP